MARSFVPLAVVGLLIGAVVPGNAQTTDPAALRAAIAKVGGRVIIALKPGTGTFLRARGTPAVSAAKMDVIEQRMMKQYRLRVQSRAEIAAALFATIADSDVVRILADTNVDYIEPDQLSMPAVKPGWYGNGTAKKLDDIIPWGVADVKAPAAWAAGLTGAGVKVGIIDGGIDYANSQLNVVGGYNFPTSDPTPAGYMDDIGACDGHGTHIAGTVGARQDGQSVVGVAPGVQLYALKVFQDVGGSCLSFLSYQIAAVNYAATNGIRVVNISIGNSGYSPSYQTAITNAIAAGVTVVASAGNNGGGSIVYPGAYAGVIAVGALDQGDTPAGYESVGPEMFIAAPGTNVQSTYPGGALVLKSGTSMAAPHVVGVVALMLQANPTWTPAQVAAAIKANAVDIFAPGFDNNTGWGLVQAPTSGGTPTPLSLAVSPAARSTSVQQGNARLPIRPVSRSREPVRAARRGPPAGAARGSH